MRAPASELVRLLLAVGVGSGIELGIGVRTADAQIIEARIGRFWDSAGWATYRLGVAQPLAGVLGVQLHGDVSRRFGNDAGGFAGVGTDLTAFRRKEGGPYLVVGLSGGLGSESSNSFSDPWGSWSAGVGYDLFPLSFLSVGAEGRWRELSLGGRDGAELALGIAVHLKGGSPIPPARQPPSPRAVEGPRIAVATPVLEPQSSPKTLADSIIATAADAMGRPYQFGGTGENGAGFDCSGLIQYAYAKHGIRLPRRSTDQAREGTKVDRKVALLKPGDLLTFSNRGGPVTHVGLYLGERRFIHSATRGVQVSTLSAEDPYGRWWYQRWVGARRIVY
ncbi:MAG TPA: C40 family peptidase [Gemmatimonadales bacterium]